MTESTHEHENRVISLTQATAINRDGQSDTVLGDAEKFYRFLEGDDGKAQSQD